MAKADAVQWAAGVVATPTGLIAVGTRYNATTIPPYGPVPQVGRIWSSSDGLAWEDITPGRTFADAALTDVFVRRDDSLVIIGTVVGDDGSEVPMAWESRDGRVWSVASVPPGYVTSVVQGAMGYLALISGATAEVWFSVDGDAWRRSRTAQWEGHFSSIGAGDDGFVITGNGASNQPIVLASSDGEQWFEAAEPPPVDHVASMGGDWFAVGFGLQSETRSVGSTPVWYSQNGLDWEQVGVHALASEPIADVVCHEYIIGLYQAAGVLTTATMLAYPCGEGRSRAPATHRISVDGMSWEPITGPWVLGADGPLMLAAAELDETPVFVGQDGNAAAFWRLER